MLVTSLLKYTLSSFFCQFFWSILVKFYILFHLSFHLLHFQFKKNNMHSFIMQKRRPQTMFENALVLHEFFRCFKNITLHFFLQAFFYFFPLLHHVYIHTVKWNRNPLCIKFVFNLLLDIPFYIPVILTLCPHSKSHGNCTRIKVIYKNINTILY